MRDLKRNKLELGHRRLMKNQYSDASSSFFEFTIEEIEKSIPERFEEQVSQYPNRIAIKTKHQEVTYSALNQKANLVARKILEKRGIGEEPIILLLDKGVSMIAALIGVLKTGKIYVPLDPSFPLSRHESILKDSDSNLIVTDTKNIEKAKDLGKNKISILDIDKLGDNQSAENPGLSISPSALAWVIYTSGSTGQPKGVVQNHRNVLHYVMNYTKGFKICMEDRLTDLFACSVNAGNHDIFTALFNGATLFPYDILKEGLTNLGDWLIQQEITIYHSVPTVFLHFVDNLTGDELFPALRIIRLGGEPVYSRHVNLYKKHFSNNSIFVNRFGSTETGTVRWHFITKDTPVPEGNVPAGFAVQDNELLLLDEDRNEVEKGQVGEIAVRSNYLSPGYWKRPNLTQSTFLSDLTDGSKRIYLTGDLGKLLPDGSLVHLGRKDFQAKIRGFRIEIAEIEVALLEHPGVKEAAVRLWEDISEENRLVAYVVPIGIKKPTISELRNFLLKSLPSYMIPSAFVMLNSLPLLPGGKVNRRALPTPDKLRPHLDTPYYPPRTPVEEELAEIWANVLDLDKVGIEDNFFDLGGNSLLATQVISRVLSNFKVTISLRSFLQSLTVAEMALIITQELANNLETKDIEKLLAELEQSPEE